MKKVSGLLVEVALLFSMAAPAMAIRPDEGALSPSNQDGGNPYRRGLKKLKKISHEDFLEAGQIAKGGKVLLNGEAAGQAAGRLTDKLRKNGSEARTVSVQTDGKGNRHIRMLQYHKGIPIVGSEMVIHVDAGNAIYAVGGNHAPDLKISENPKLAPAEAGAAALSAIVMKQGAVERHSPRLVFFDDALAYEVEIKEAGKSPKLWRTYIDAKTGAILFRENRIIHGAPVGGAAFPVQGSRLTGEGGTVTSITGWRDDNGVHFLRNNTARWGVYDQDRFDWSQQATADWGTTDRAAISLAKNIETTRNYVATVLGRNSYDNAGAFVNAYVHEGTNYVNAYWDGSGLYFGDGDGVTSNPLTVLDVAAHEFGHAITQHTSNLIYSYESGALNESYSDIMGALVEFWAQPDGRSSYPAGADGRADYLVGEDCWVGAEALRDMRNPLRFGSPSYYLGTSWNAGSSDNGGVHTNSGVQNFAFYLLAEGGTGSNDGHAYSINGLGIQAAGEIAMYANMYLLTSSSQYRDAREAWILAASTLGHNVQTVRDVWTACGVLEQVNNLAVSPANLDFGNVGLGYPLVLNLTLSNNGALSTTVTSVAFSNAAYSTTATLPLTVPGAGSVTFPVRFAPVSQGNQSGQVTFTSNADDNPTLTASLSGMGTNPAVVMVSPGSINAAAAVGDSVTAIVSVTNAGGADLYVTAETAENQAAVQPQARRLDVLFLSAGNYFSGFESQVRALANVQTLTLFDGSISTPTLAQLQAYDAVIVASGTAWVSPLGVGNVLADYADAGGGIVLMGATFHIGGSWQLEGRIMTPVYAPLAAANYSYSTTVTSSSLAAHAINQGVSTLTSGLYAFNTVSQGGGIPLGVYTGGYLVGAAQTGKSIVSLNAYPYTGYFSGDLVLQVGNALNHVGSGSWLSVGNSGVPVRITTGGAAPFPVKMSAARILGGTYTGSLRLSHNGIATANPLVIPITFAVDGFRRLSAAPASLAYGSRMAGSTTQLTLTLTNSGDEATSIASLQSNHPAFAVVGVAPTVLPGGQSVQVQVAFTPPSIGNQTGILTITSNAEDNPSVAVALSGAGTAAPRLELFPASIQATVNAGGSVPENLEIRNTGGLDLTYSLAGAGGSDILINEFCNNPDFIELWNRGADRAIGGWRVSWIDNASSEVLSFTFPAGTILRAGRRVVIRESTGAANDSTFYAGGNIGWVEGSIVSVALADAQGAGVDFVRTTGSATLPPAGTSWTGAGVPFGSYTAYRNRSADSDDSAGWASGSSPSEFRLNPGQTDAGSLPAWLTAIPASGTVAPGGVGAVALTLNSAGMFGGTYNATLLVRSNDPSAPVAGSPVPVEFTVVGVKRLSVSASSVTFGDVWMGTVAKRRLTLSNSGSEATTVTSLNFGHAAFAALTAPPLTVPPFGSVSFDLSFSPLSSGTLNSTLAIASDASDNPSLTIDLMGVGVAPPSATLTPSALTLALTPDQAPADRLSILANVGGAAMAYRVVSVSQTGSPLAPLTPFTPPGLALATSPALPAIRTGILYAESNFDHAYAPGRVIVAFKPGLGGFADSRTPASVGIRGMRELAAAVNPKTRVKAHAGRKLMLLEIEDPAGVRAAIEVFRQDANVAYAEPDFIQRAVAAPDDPSFNLLYGMHNTGQTGGAADADIDAPEAWNRHTGNRSVLIGVIDTGIDYLHPDLAANMWTNPGEIAGNNLDDDGNGFIDDVHGWDFAYDDSNPMDGHYHGTHCAGTIAGVGGNAIGVAGVMWSASVVAIKFLDDGGGGSTSDAIDAVNYANAMDIRITSNSWGGGGFSQALMDAIAGGGLFIAAAGNSASNNDVSPHYPSNYDLDNIVSVAATDHSDALASFSCFGATTVDLGAPGVSIYSAAPSGSYQYLSGTSMATPHVSGAAGLVWTFNPSLTAAQVKAALMTSANPIPSLAGRTVTGGRLNVNGALDEAGPSWLTASPTTPGTLAPGLTAPITVTVNPAGLVAGRWTGVVNVATDDPIHPELPITVAADIAGCRSIAVVPGAFDFGAVWVGTTARTTFTLRNDCNDAATLTSLQFGRTEFRSLASLPLSVPAFGQAQIEVEFIPSAAGAIVTAMTLATNADADPIKTAALTGSGVLPPRISANPGAFVKVIPVGETRTDVLNISNQGGADLQWSAQFVLESMPAGTAQAALARHQANLLPPAAPNYLDRKPEAGPQAGSSGQPSLAGPASPAAFPAPVPAAVSVIGAEAWNPLRSMTSVRSQFGLSAPGNGKIYAFGGWNGTSLSNTLEIYDIAANAWSAGAPVPVYDRGFATATAADGVIYYIGGTQSSCYKYDTRADVWSSIAAPPQTAIWEASALAGDDGRIYVFGGGSYTPINAVQIYNPATNTWTLGAPMSTPRVQAGAAKIAGGLMLVAGGIVNTSWTLTTAVEIYNPATNTWSAATPMPVTRNQFGISTGADGKVYVIGGKQSWYNNTAPFFSTVWAYDPASGAWSAADALPASLGELEAVTAGGVIFAAGGTNGTYSAAMQTLQTVGAVSFSPASGNVLAGQSMPVTVTFDARALRGGVYSGSLRIAHNDPVGANPLAVPVTMTVDGMRRLSSAVASLDFGNVWAGATRSLNLRLDNAGDEATVISGIASDDPEFTVTGSFPATLAPGASLMVPVVFRPSDQGAETAVLTILSNAEDNPTLTVSLSGTGTAPPEAQLTPSAFTLNLAPSDAPVDRTATLANVGGDILTYQIVSVAETGSPLLRESPPISAAVPDEAKIYAAGNYAQAHAPGEVIVALKPGYQNLSGPAVFPALGVTEVKELATARNPRTGLRAHGGRKLLLIKTPALDASSLAETISRLKADANVAYAEPNYVRTLGAIPNDAGFANLYGMHNTGQSGGLADADIDAPEAWDRHTGNRSLVLGLIDTGIDYLHPDLAANVWTNPGEIAGNGIDDDGNGYVDDIRGYDFINNDGNPMDDHYHGTHCAGTIAGVGGNGIGVAGVAWTASVAGLKIFNSSGSTTDAAILNAVDYSNAMGMRITSNSWGGGPYSQSLFDLIAEGRDLGHLFIAAAGNNGSNTDASPNYPSGYDLPNIISVAATDRNDLLAGFSNYGALTVDLGAPGVDTYSCAPGSGYQNLSGTSMATPHVSGAAYLVLSANPSLTGAALKAILLGSVDPIPSLSGRTVTGGRLNVAEALADAGPQWLSATPTAPGSIAPGASIPLTVTVNPAGLTAGVWTGVVTVASNDPVRATLPLTVTAIISGCRSLSISPASHGFGTVFVGASAQTTLTLSNPCNDAVTVSALASSHAAFTGSAALPITIPAFGQATMNAVFRPTVAGAVSAIFTFTTNTDTNPIKTVDLTGTGAVPPHATVNPASIARTLSSGASTVANLDIGNSGGAVLDWTLSGVDGSSAPFAPYDATHFVPMAKGQADARTGRPVLEAVGGPDAAGYRWTDSDAPGGPTFQWTDIRATGTLMSGISSCDDCYQFQTFSFPFTFYGTAFTSMYVTSNGYLSFTAATSQYGNYPLPTTSMPRNLVAGFFDDLYTGGTGDVYFQDMGNRAIIQYQNVARLAGDGTVTFQIVLNSDGTIMLYYLSVTGNLLSATTGIQNASGTVGLNVQYNAAYLKNNLAVRLGALPEWLHASVLSGTVQPGAVQQIQLTLNSTTLQPGIYTQNLTLGHNNPLEASLTIPVTLTVESAGRISRILRIGPSSLPMAAGGPYYLWNVTVGGEARGITRGSRYTLFLK